LKDYHKQESSIFLVFHFGASTMVGRKKCYRPLKYSVGESIRTEHWNKKAGRAREYSTFPQYEALNTRLRFVENLVHSVLLTLKNNAIVPTREILRKILDQKLQKNEQGAKVTMLNKNSFIHFIEKYSKEASYHKSRGTVTQYQNTLRLLKDYVAKTKKPLHFDMVNLDFYADFRRYMNEQGYSDNYFGNQIKFIRLFMSEATERGYTTQTHYKSRRFTTLQTKSLKIYLTEKEIGTLQSLDLSDRLFHEQIRDIFIVGCRTGLRYSDLMLLNPANFMDDKKILRIETKKTKELIHIPISKDVIGIFEKYNFRLPQIHNASFNFHIKKIGLVAGLTQEMEVAVSKGNERHREVFKKYELISAHTARRSFATNAYLEQVPTIAIMQITGHRTETSFLKYIRITNENSARQILSHPYFSR
jgi:integrase